MPLTSPSSDSQTRHRKSFVAELEQQIRTPMNTIIGLSSSEVAKGTLKDQTETFQKINNAATSLMGVLDNLLSVSKVEAGRLKINQEIFDVESVIADACNVYFERLVEKKTELIINIDPRISSKLLGDGTQLWQMLRKILETAVNFNGGGEIYLTATRKHQQSEQEELKFIIFAGVTAEREQEALRYYGIVPGENGEISMDPGLAEVCQIVENNKGEILFENADSGEIICVFTMAFARVTENIPSIGTLHADKYIGLRGREALIVSSGNSLVDNLTSILQVANIECQVAADVAEAQDLLTQRMAGKKVPDIIIVDLHLDEWRPEKLLNIYRRNGRQTVPCLLLASNAEYELCEQRQRGDGTSLAELGIGDCLEKPLTIRAVLSKIAYYLRKTISVEKEPFSVDNSQSAAPITTPQLTLSTFPEKQVNWQIVARFLTGYNQRNALQLLDNNFELYGKMLADFYRSLEKELGDWHDHNGDIDREALRISAHNIKSMAAYVGADNLHKIALETENACKQPAADLTPYFQQYISTCGATMRMLQEAHMASLGEPDNGVILKQLYSAVEFCECNLAKRYAQAMNAGLRIWPENALAALRQDVSEFKFTEIAQMLSEHGITEGAPLPPSDLPTILIIDDAPEAISILYNLFADECNFCATTSGPMALRWLEKFHADLILLDVVMPEMNGIKTYKKIRECPHAQGTPIIFISGVSETEVEREVLNLGAADYILKPYNVATVQAKVHNQLALKKRHDQLANTVREQEAALTQTQEAVIHGMAHLAEYRENYTGEHLKRIKSFTEILAAKLRQMHPEQLSELDVHYQTALSPVHDIGKVGIRDDILKKMGPLTPEEFEEMKRHTIYGAEVIQRTQEDLGISNMVMELACQIVTSHHERYDGSGYPYGLKGTAIPLAARIVSLADVYDALVSERPYKPAFTHDQTMTIITQGDKRTRPEHFDPLVLAALVAAQDDFYRVIQQ